MSASGAAADPAVAAAKLATTLGAGMGAGGPEMIGDDEYESLPISAGFSTFMMAGAAAGMMEHCVMYPVDTVKTRMQSIIPTQSCAYDGVADAFRKISRAEGMFRTIRGLNVVAMGAGPAHALYFSCYETMKDVFSTSVGTIPGQNPFANAAAGACATVIHDGFMNPVEVVKQRLQMACSPYKSTYECIRTVHAREGFGAFYRSYSTQLIMNIPFQMTHFTCYEALQEVVNPEREYSPWTHMFAGGLAGAFAAAVTTPLDVCKTVLNTQEACVSCNVFTGQMTVMGIRQAARKIYSVKGIWGFWSGLNARIMFQIPATALTWSVYEFFKHFIVKKQQEKADSLAALIESSSSSSPSQNLPSHKNNTIVKGDHG